MPLAVSIDRILLWMLSALNEPALPEGMLGTEPDSLEWGTWQADLHGKDESKD